MNYGRLTRVENRIIASLLSLLVATPLKFCWQSVSPLTFYILLTLSLIGSAVQQNRAQLLGFLNATVDAGNSALHVWRGYVLYCWSFLSLTMLSNCEFVLESVTVLAHLMLNLWFSTPGLLLQQRDRLHNVLEHHHRHSQHGSVNSWCFLVFKPQCFLQELQIVCVCVCV